MNGGWLVRYRYTQNYLVDSFHSCRGASGISYVVDVIERVGVVTFEGTDSCGYFTRTVGTRSEGRIDDRDALATIRESRYYVLIGGTCR